MMEEDQYPALTRILTSSAPRYSPWLPSSLGSFPPFTLRELRWPRRSPSIPLFSLHIFLFILLWVCLLLVKINTSMYMLFLQSFVFPIFLQASPLKLIVPSNQMSAPFVSHSLASLEHQIWVTYWKPKAGQRRVTALKTFRDECEICK